MMDRRAGFNAIEWQVQVLKWHDSPRSRKDSIAQHLVRAQIGKNDSSKMTKTKRSNFGQDKKKKEDTQAAS